MLLISWKKLIDTISVIVSGAKVARGVVMALIEDRLLLCLRLNRG